MSKTRLIKTRDFDEIEILESEIISFHEGIFGFEEMKEYVIIAPRGENQFPVWLQSVENPGLCFILFNPVEICADYNVTVTKAERKKLGLTDADKDQPEYLVIANIKEKYIDTTVNLKSPLAFNTKNNTAMQVIAPENYPLRFPIFRKEEG